MATPALRPVCDVLEALAGEVDPTDRAEVDALLELIVEHGLSECIVAACSDGATGAELNGERLSLAVALVPLIAPRCPLPARPPWNRSHTVAHLAAWANRWIPDRIEPTPKHRHAGELDRLIAALNVTRDPDAAEVSNYGTTRRGHGHYGDLPKLIDWTIAHGRDDPDRELRLELARARRRARLTGLAGAT